MTDIIHWKTPDARIYVDAQDLLTFISEHQDEDPDEIVAKLINILRRGVSR